MRNKRTIIVDPVKDSIINPILNDLIKNGKAIYEYKGKTEKWIKASGKIGSKAKKLIHEKPRMLYPPSTSRPHQMGFIILPDGVNVTKKQYGKKIKYIFNRKIF